MRARLTLALIVGGGFVLATGGVLATATTAAGTPPSGYPDLRTVVPTHLNFVNQQQQEYLRFSNGIANTGSGPWALRPENELGLNPTTTAIQEIRSSNARYLCGTEPKPDEPCYTLLDEEPVRRFAMCQALDEPPLRNVRIPAKYVLSRVHSSRRSTTPAIRASTASSRPTSSTGCRRSTARPVSLRAS